ncbi:MAG: cytochrome c oxidase subunit II [Flavobacteriales bacterium]|jgi:cytochrome c oxidase subunit 2
MKLLILLVVVLGIIAIAQLTKVYELTRSLRKTREEEISNADNKMNAFLMIVWMIAFFAGVIYLYVRYGDYLPEAASEHGVKVDQLMNINIILITIVFFIVNYLLFTLSYRFYYRKDRRARFFAHDSRYEMAWTLIPGVTMAFIIVYGLITWNSMTGEASADAIQIEVYSKQFDWTVRYPGDNKTFGASDFNLIGGTNALGMVTRDGIREKLDTLDAEIEAITKQLENNKSMPIMPEAWVESLEDKMYRLQRHKQRIMDLSENKVNGLSQWEAGADDRIVKGELHIPVGKEVEFIFRSQDVIHSAYMPHFRAQMNTVPGVPTRFKMTPTITTAEMRKKMDNDEFDYLLLCNKVCGAAHFNMQIKVIVEDEASYQAWLASQKTFAGAEAPATEPAAEDSSSKPDSTQKATAAPAGATAMLKN